jgi:hypothetical protein
MEHWHREVGQRQRPPPTHVIGRPSFLRGAARDRSGWRHGLAAGKLAGPKAAAGCRSPGRFARIAPRVPLASLRDSRVQVAHALHRISSGGIFLGFARQLQGAHERPEKEEVSEHLWASGSVQALLLRADSRENANALKVLQQHDVVSFGWQHVEAVVRGDPNTKHKVQSTKYKMSWTGSGRSKAGGHHASESGSRR